MSGGALRRGERHAVALQRAASAQTLGPLD